MPLLGDSKSVYVGTTPITKVMAGEVEVWPKVPPTPDSPFVGMRFPLHRQIVNYPVFWDVEQEECNLLDQYEVRYGWSADYPDGDGTTPPATWQPWEDLWTEDCAVFDAVNKKIYWSNVYAEVDYNGLGKFTWAEVRDKYSQETVVAPIQTNVHAAEITYPPTGVECFYPPRTPGGYPPSSSVAFYHFDGDLKSEGGLVPSLTSKGVLGYEFLESFHNQCVSPQGSSGDVMFLESKLEGLSRPYTIEAWFKIPYITFQYGTSAFIGYETYEGTNDRDVDLNTLSISVMNGKIVARSGFIPRNSAPNYNEILVDFATANIEAEEWFHVAASCTPDGKSLRMHANGHYEGTEDNAGFDPRYPLKWIKVQTRSQYNREKIQIDELRISKNIVYPAEDINIQPS